MSFEKGYGDITQYSEDAMVTPTNTKRVVGYEVDFKIYDRDGINSLEAGLDQYIRENCYSSLDVNNYRMLEKEWSSLPKGHEERKILELMRLQFARMKSDAEQYRKFKEKQYIEEKTSYSYVTFSKMLFSQRLDQAIVGNQKPKFRDVFEKFRLEKSAGNYREICRKANLREDTLSKLRSASINPNRDYLWALSIAMKLNLDETEELFQSCGLSTKGNDSRMLPIEEARERAFEFFIKEEMYCIKTINRELAKRGYANLGNLIV